MLIVCDMALEGNKSDSQPSTGREQPEQRQTTVTEKSMEVAVQVITLTTTAVEDSVQEQKPKEDQPDPLQTNMIEDLLKEQKLPPKDQPDYPHSITSLENGFPALPTPSVPVYVDLFPALMSPTVRPAPAPLPIKKKAKKVAAVIKTQSSTTTPLIADSSQHRSPAQGGAVRPPTRPGTGKDGRAISLSANHFPITVKNPTMCHYDVDIKPTPPKPLFKKILEQWMEGDDRFQTCSAVFDSVRNLYTARRIPGLNSKIEIKHRFRERGVESDKDKDFVIYIKPTGELEVDLTALAAYCENGSSIEIPLRSIQAVDIVMKYGALKQINRVLVDSCLLSQPNGRITELGNGVELWFGHFQSLRLGWKAFLNVDATQKAFFKSGPLHEIMASMTDSRPGVKLDERAYSEFGRKITTLKINYSRGNYVATLVCNGLKGSADSERFECDGKTVTVQQYFEQKLGMKLKYPHLPCVWVGNRKKTNLVPMELCSLAPGQEYRRKLNEQQTATMIRASATPADERKKKIEDALTSMQFNTDPHLREFGITIESKMAQVTGRVLPAPKLAYGIQESNTVIPKDGVWHMKNVKFVDARSMTHFGVMNITRCQEKDINTFLDAVYRLGREMGMGMGKCLFVQNTSLECLERDMTGFKKRFPLLQILFVIINRKGDPAYEIVKRVGDLDLQLTTQCVQMKTVIGSGRLSSGPDPATVSNICLKLNAKLGGINNLISRDVRPQILLNEQVVVMGADVTHPGADQQDSGKPSIAAVVASVDPRAAQYVCEIRLQKSKQEYIEDMENMVYNLLLKFNRATSSTSTGKPQRIFFYRDGVSEGQFAKVLEWELVAIRKACRRLQRDYEPPITFVIVQKRHHTRLFPNNSSDECGRGKNVPPGTVVDSTIVHPKEQDFFLVSHQGIQGTSRPTHYHVLWDDNKLKPDSLQKLTYYLCYLFSRCNRSVSYPAPCYYSHLVAYRARQYFEGLTKSRGGCHVTSRELQKHIDSVRHMSFMFFI